MHINSPEYDRMMLKSSFLSCEKDLKIILEKLFMNKQKPAYSEDLKRLLMINTKDCIDDYQNPIYKDLIKNVTVASLREQGYIRLEPKLPMSEHEDVRSYLMISFDNFSTNMSNPEFRDCYVQFDILCHTDYWDIGDFRLRPLKIAGYIDGILNNTKLTGIGTFQFAGCSELVLSEDLSGYSVIYQAIHGEDDKIG